MIVSINQPAYLPYPGYFHRIEVSDIHIVLDHVQFEKNSLTNRNKIRNKDGWSWLTVPLKTKGKFGNLPINEVEISNTGNWKKKHWNSIKSNYSKAIFFCDHADFFEKIFERDWTKLIDLIKETTDYSLDVFNSKTTIMYSSQMRVKGKKDELVLNLCKEVGADIYLSGIMGKDYLDEEKFIESGIKVYYQNYNFPEYNQVFPGFEPYMSVIDLLFNHGPDSKKIFLKDQEEIIDT